MGCSWEEGSCSLWQDGDESNSDQGAESNVDQGAESNSRTKSKLPGASSPYAPSPPTPFLLNEKTWSLIQAAINLLRESELTETESQPHTHTHTHPSTKENKQSKINKINKTKIPKNKTKISTKETNTRKGGEINWEVEIDTYALLYIK